MQYKRSGRPPKLNEQQKLEIIDLYCKDKKSTNQIADMFKISSETVRNTLHRAGIRRRSIGESNKLLTIFSFKEMTPEKAFLVGLIYGDGSISNRNDYINLTTGDLDLVEKSQKIFGDKFKISKVKDSNCYCGIIYSHKLCEELFDLFALTNDKSDKLIFPYLSDYLFPFFISGYLATDGCITIRQSKTQKPSLVLSFYSCSKDFLSHLNKYICEKIEIDERSIYERTNIKGHFGKKPLYVLSFNGRFAKLSCDYIFNFTTSLTRGDRKYNIYKNFNG